jgi:transposase
MEAQCSNLFPEATTMESQNAGLRYLIERHLEREVLYQSEIAWLTENLLKVRRERFGAMKERWQSEEQIIFFNEAEVESAKPDPESEATDSEVAVEGFKRKRGKRAPLPRALPREIVVVELPENERFTDDGLPLIVVGREISEKLFFEPAQIKVLEYHRCRYGVDSGEPIKTAPPVPSIIPKGIVTPSLLADIMVNKYADGLPLYRQEEMWERTGIHLSRGSMGRWIVQAASACMPVWNVLEGWLLDETYVSCDETHTQVLKEKGRAPETKSWMWVRGTPDRKQPIVLFDYDPHRSGEVAKKLFADYRGFLQSDAYSAYLCLEKQEGVTRIGCNMHGRRGFSDANKGAKEGRGLAAKALKFYQLLYDVEEKAKKLGLSAADRKLLRDVEQVPIWDEMKIWADKTITRVPKKSLIGKALGYWTSQYDLLRGYLVDGRLEMDNGFAERTIRKFAIGRNNWMFSDTPEGAHASALFYSFVVTAKLNGVNPYKALRTIFERIPLASTLEDYEALAKLLLSPAVAA